MAATIQQLEANLKAEITRIGRQTAFGLHERIVNDTPIDTGRAKSSWNLSQDTPNFDVTPQLYSGNSKGDIHHKLFGEAEGTGTPISAEQALIAAQSSQQAVGPDAKVIFIANGLNYIEGLEHGSSKQAPAGMVMKNITIDEIETLVDAAIAQKTP